MANQPTAKTSRYSLERDPSRIENAFCVIDNSITPQNGDNTPEDRIVGWYATPQEGLDAITALLRPPVGVENMSTKVLALDARQSSPLDRARMEEPDESEPDEEEEVTTDPQEKLRRSIKVLRKHMVEAAREEGIEDVVAAMIDAGVAFVYANQKTSDQLERIANALVAQTKMVALTLSEGLTGEERSTRLADAKDSLKE